MILRNIHDLVIITTDFKINANFFASYKTILMITRITIICIYVLCWVIGIKKKLGTFYCSLDVCRLIMEYKIVKILFTRALTLVFLSLATNAYGLPDCAGGIYHNCYGSFTGTDGREYTGEWKDGKYHGQGAYTFSIGSKYAGDKYTGQFKDNKSHGKGSYFWANGDTYIGEFKNGSRNNQGVFTLSDGGKYVGEWKDGKINGQGTFSYSDGSKYIGEWLDGKINGQGAFTWADGAEYVGRLKNEKRHGQGAFTLSDGSKYVGAWKNDQKHGLGAWFDPDGTKENGIYANDRYLFKKSVAESKEFCAKEAGKANTEYAAKQIEKTCLINKGLEPEPEPEQKPKPEPKAWYEW